MRNRNVVNDDDDDGDKKKGKNEKEIRRSYKKVIQRMLGFCAYV